MSGYVYIRCNKTEWNNFRQKIKINKGFDGLIKCVALKYYKDKKYIGKAKNLIVEEANNLLNCKKSSEGLTDEILTVYHRVSLKQISSLRRPKSGYTTCYAGIILMAIINLLCEGGQGNVFQNLKILCLNPNVDFLDFALKEQYNCILHAYKSQKGEFGNIDSQQYKLVRYCNTSYNRFNQHFENHTYNYIVNHLDSDHIFQYQDSVPGYIDHDLVR